MMLSYLLVLFVGAAIWGLVALHSQADKPNKHVTYRYTIERLGYPPETVDAADANTDDLDVQTVHFMDHDGNTIAIYSHVLKVTSLEAEKHVGRG